VSARIQRLDAGEELTIISAAPLYHTLLSYLDGRGRIEIDLSRVSEMDTAGLQILLLAHRECAARKLRLTLRQPSPAVLEVLTLARLNTNLESDAD
jgi:anti-sigma B factor antagonist